MIGYTNSCDSCFRSSYKQIQTDENDWLCPDCADKNTCYECGRVTLEWGMKEVDGNIVRLCPDCEIIYKEDMKEITKYWKSKADTHDLMDDFMSRHYFKDGGMPDELTEGEVALIELMYGPNKLKP